MLCQVYIYVKKPKRESRRTDRFYLCHDGNSSIPWEFDVFYVEDSQGRCWFCHELHVPFTKPALTRLANSIKKENTPTSPGALLRRMNKPLVIQAAACRAGSMAELVSQLGTITLKGEQAT